MLDMATLTATLMQFLAPALPYLMNVGDKALDGAIGKMGEDGWKTAKALWGKLWPHIEQEPATKKAAEKAATDPTNPDRQTALKLALQDLLEEQPGLQQELAKLLQDAKPMPTIQVEIHSQGNNNQNVGVNYGQVQS